MLATSLLASLLLLTGCSGSASVVTSLTPPSTGAAAAGDPAIALEPGSGDVLLAWLAGDSTGYRVWFARSADQGGSWSPPVAVSPPAEPLRMNPETSPRMVCDGEGRVAITWSTAVETPARRLPASDVRFARSLDRGVTWSGALTLNDDTTGAPGRHAFHDLTLSPGGAIVAAWLDERPGGDGNAPDSPSGSNASIYQVRSRDFGGHWGANVASWSRACAGCRVGLAGDLLGHVITTYRKRYPGNIRDVVAVGEQGAPVRVHVDAWKVADCPGASPAIAVPHDGTLRVAWFTGTEGRRGVWFRQCMPASLDSSVTPLPVLVSERLPTTHVGLGEAGMRGTLLACDADSTGARQLTLARVDPSGKRVRERFVVPGAQGVAYPRVAALNTSADAYVVWTSQDGARSKLGLARWRVGR